jgi:hypothetical protein
MDANERIETLIPYRDLEFRPRKGLGTLDLEAHPATICKKLGGHLLSGLPPERDAELAQLAASWFVPLVNAATSVPEPEPAPDPEPGTLLHRLLADSGTKEGARSLFTAGEGRGVLVDHAASLKRRFQVPKADFYIKGRPALGRVTLTAFRLDFALGAISLLGDRPVLSAAALDGVGLKAGAAWRWLGLEGAEYLRERARERWEEEGCLEANRRYAHPAEHLAGVFEDKRECDDAHRAAAASGYIAGRFAHVEIDDEVDLGLYRRLQDEFELRDRAGELPKVDQGELSLRFRKTGRHRAIGLYCDALKAVAVDPRAPRSLLHEFAHSYDYSHGMLSCSEGFRPILRDFTANFRPPDGPLLSKAGYYCTPTEVFARSWEVYASLNGIGGSFVERPEYYRAHPAYSPLVANGEAVRGYFSAFAPAPTAEQSAEAAERMRLAHAPRPMRLLQELSEPLPDEPPRGELPEVPLGAQIPLFYIGERWVYAEPASPRDDVFSSRQAEPAAQPPSLRQTAESARRACGASPAGGRRL